MNNKNTNKKQNFKNLVKIKNLLVIIIIFLIIILFLFFLNIANVGQLNWGMKIAGTPVSGLSIKEAEELLESKCEYFLNEEFFLHYQGNYWQTTSKKLGVEVDIDGTINLAFNKGHEGNKLLANIWWQFLSLFGYNVKPILKVNEEKLNSFLETNIASIHQPAINSSLVYDKESQDFITTESKKGQIVDTEKLKKEINKKLNNLEKKDIELTVLKDEPIVTESETEKAKEKIKEIIAVAPYEIFIEQNQEKIKVDEITKEMILDFLEFKPTVDLNNPLNKILGIKANEEKIKEYLMYISPLVNKESINAKLSIQNGKVVAFALSENGIKLEIKENTKEISKSLLSTKNEIRLEINEIEPEITTESIDNLGITNLLATGTSNFSGSPESRIHNIRTGTAKFEGVLIKPDEEFSFNEVLGEVGPEQGYKPELVIKKDKTIPEYGGGLCQVSTTIFRAAIYAGLEITQRYPHAFPVKYYNPQGFDATIYPPFPDLKFINNTPSYILIQSKIENNELIFELYGADDERTIEVIGPYQYEINEDGSMKATLTQKVYDRDGNELINKTFYSNYKSPDLYPVEKNPLE